MGEEYFCFGLGTGRCGTVSLSKLLAAQKNSNVTHEGEPFLPWELNSDLVDKKVSLIRGRSSIIKGEVALYYLNSVETILEKIPNAKFIVLIRKKLNTIDSFERKWKPKYNRLSCKKKPWDSVFPKYDVKSSISQCVNKYYDEYYRKVFSLVNKHPHNVKCTWMQELNTYEGVKEILDFYAIPEEYRVYKTGITANKGNRA